MSGFSNKMQAAMAYLMPAGMLAEQHRKMTEPGTGRGDRSADKCDQSATSRFGETCVIS